MNCLLINRQFAPNVSLAPESYDKVKSSGVKIEDQWEESRDSMLRKIPISKRRHDSGYNSGYASDLHGKFRRMFFVIGI